MKTVKITDLTMDVRHQKGNNQRGNDNMTKRNKVCSDCWGQIQSRITDERIMRHP